MSNKTNINGLLPQELCSQFSLEPAFRGRQVFQWLARGADSFDGMTNIGRETRARLAQEARPFSSQVTQALRDADGTIKLQVTLADGRAVEVVLLTDRAGRRTACVSCQTGCAMGCAFCQTGRLGAGRNLDAGEIVEEFRHLEREAGRLDSIVFMGMGEPLQNLPAIRRALEVLSHPHGRALSLRRVTLSTCGLAAGIRDLADNGPQVRLAVSLTTANQGLRERLMPVARAVPLGALREAIAYYIERTGRRVTLEAALLAGTNTSPQSAQELAEFAGGLDVHINLIPWNPVAGLDFATPTPRECTAFVRLLEQAGLNVSLRMRRGTGVAGACGQLGQAAPGGVPLRRP